MPGRRINFDPEVLRATLDPEKFLAKYFHIVDKHRRLVPFELKKAQRHLLGQIRQRAQLEGRKTGTLVGRDIGLKSRKLGMTTLALGLATHECMTVDNTAAAFISYEKTRTQRSFRIVHTALSKMPKEDSGVVIKPATSKQTVNEIVFENSNSHMFVGTAGGMQFGRGDTPNIVVLDEYAFYNPEAVADLNAGLLNALDVMDSWVFVISTPNGHNHFRSLYMKAKEGAEDESTGSIWTPHFYPWWWDEEDSSIPPGHPRVPDAYRDDFMPTEAEARLMLDHNLSLDNIRWRRMKIKGMEETNDGDERLFRQEYPENDIDCFLFSEDLFFESDAIEHYISLARPPINRQNNGIVQIWKPADAQGKYIIGADPSEGLSTSHSRSTACVLNVLTGEHVATVRGRVPPEEFANMLASVGQYYNNALLAVERNNHGHTVLLKLRSLGYPRIYTERRSQNRRNGVVDIKQGWLNHPNTRIVLLDELATGINERHIISYDSGLAEEMAAFRWSDKKQRPEKESGGWDDTILSLAIAWHLRYNAIKSGQYGAGFRRSI